MVSSYIDTKAFSSKQLLAKFTPLEEATKAVTDIVVLSPARKEDVPARYQRLPYDNTHLQYIHPCTQAFTCSEPGC